MAYTRKAAIEKTCVVCKKTFICKTTAITCSAECGKIHTRERALSNYYKKSREKNKKEEEKAKPKMQTTAEIVNIARSMGLSYGEYVAMRDSSIYAHVEREAFA